MRLEARRVTARCEMMNCLAKQIAIEVGGFCILSRSFLGVPVWLLMKGARGVSD
jgi:hypothetical protein